MLLLYCGRVSVRWRGCLIRRLSIMLLSRLTCRVHGWVMLVLRCSTLVVGLVVSRVLCMRLRWLLLLFGGRVGWRWRFRIVVLRLR